MSCVASHSPTHVVLPKPAGAETSAICLPDASPSSSRRMRSGRGTRPGGITGRCSFVASKPGFKEPPVSGAPPRATWAARGALRRALSHSSARRATAGVPGLVDAMGPGAVAPAGRLHAGTTASQRPDSAGRARAADDGTRPHSQRKVLAETTIPTTSIPTSTPTSGRCALQGRPIHRPRSRLTT